MNRKMQATVRAPGTRRVLVVVVTLVMLMAAIPATPAAVQAFAVPIGLPDDIAGARTGGATKTSFDLPWTLPAVSYRIRLPADDTNRNLPTYAPTGGNDGIYALAYDDLASANLPVATLDPRSLHMYAMGKEIPIRVIGEDDGRFDQGDVLLFYGRTVDSLFLDGVYPTNKYTGANTYFLSYGCASGPCAGPFGLRMAEADGSGSGNDAGPFVHREHLHRNFWYFSSYPFEHDADHWYADWINPSQARTYSFNVFNLPMTSGNAILKLNLLGWGNNRHHLQLWVNNSANPAPILDGSPGWSGFTSYETTVSVPRSYLVEGLNRIRVGLVLEPGVPSDMVYLNWLDLQYYDSHVAESGQLAFRNEELGPRRYEIGGFTEPTVEVYDVTDSFTPERVSATTSSGAGPYAVSFGGSASAPQRYLAVEPAAWKKPAAIDRVTLAGSTYQPADLLSASNSADYIIISHRAFWTQAQTLAAFRDRDFQVALVDVQQIYDQFNGGMMSAESIRDFLAYAYAHWNAPAPSYVLLLGDGTNDMRYNRTTTETFIPPYLYLADPDLGETAAENRFVTFLGNDNIPDMHIGRFPVNTSEQAQAMVDKTINYETGCYCNDKWNLNTLFVTDDLEGGGGDFYAYSDMVADGFVDPPTNTLKLLPLEYNVTKAYLGKTCDTNNPADAAGCRSMITSTMNITGSLLVSYIGHSTKEIWGGENIYNKAAVETLSNGPCLPVMLAMTCYEGSFFDYGTYEVLAEANVRKRGAGAVASWSPTGFGLVTGHDYLEQGIFLAWFHRGINRLGPATTYAKQYLADNAKTVSGVPLYRDLLDTFVLLGDPGLTVKIGDACLSPTGVRATSFTASQEPNGVRLSWQTADESDMIGFNLLRRHGQSGPFLQVNGDLILANHAGTQHGTGYSYLDASMRMGQAYHYKLQIVNRDGSREEFGSAESNTTGLHFYLPVVW